jgi:hypothetical protein
MRMNSCFPLLWRSKDKLKFRSSWPPTQDLNHQPLDIVGINAGKRARIACLPLMEAGVEFEAVDFFAIAVVVGSRALLS